MNQNLCRLIHMSHQVLAISQTTAVHLVTQVVHMILEVLIQALALGIKYIKYLFFAVIFLLPLNTSIQGTRQMTQGQVFFVPDIKEEKQCVLEALYYEIRNGSYAEKQAVLSVIINRTKSSLYPKTFCAVIQQYKQFSYTLTDFEKPQLHATSKFDKIQLEICNDLADRAVEGNFKTVLPKEVLWYARKYVTNSWTRKYKVYKSYEWHHFYRK